MKLWELLETTDCIIYLKDSYHDDVVLVLLPCINQSSNEVFGYISDNERSFAIFSDWNVSKIHIVKNGLEVYVK